MALSSRAALALLFLAAAAVLATALLSQYAGGLVPCELCLYERWPYYLALPVALALLTADTTPADRRLGAAVLMLVFAASAVLAFYHFGVERHWFAGPTACTASITVPKTLAELKAMMAAQAAVRCDVPQWSVFGVTLAGLNLLASLVLLALAALALRVRR